MQLIHWQQALPAASSQRDASDAGLDMLFGTWTGILSLAVNCIVIIGYLFYKLFIKPPQE